MTIKSKNNQLSTPIVILLLTLTTMQNPFTIFNFTPQSDITNWTVINDVVMGGLSSAKIDITQDGYGVFEGHVSLDNNGGFSSLRHRFNTLNIKPFTKIILKIKGDGKNYQFRIKSNSQDSHSYIHNFKTSGHWETVEIALNTMEPKFRGRKLNMTNFCHDSLEEIAFLIGNKKEEHFKLLIDVISIAP